MPAKDRRLETDTGLNDFSRLSFSRRLDTIGSMKTSSTARYFLLAAAFAALPFQASAQRPQAQTGPFAEMEKTILERFPEADKDKNGRISREEFQDLQADLRKRGLGPSALGPKPTVVAAQYGPHERNVLDFWKADTTGPAPVLVFIHGGGFVAGSKDQVDPYSISQCLKWGIAFASISYRYSNQAIAPAPMQDGARAIQFLRSKAQEWSIDPARIAAFGGSAGAGISMWIGFHDDLAKPDSADLIGRQSSRLACIATQGGQCTYDPVVIREWIGGRAWEHPALRSLFGVKTNEDFEKPEIRKLATDCAAITHLTRDDPPIFMIYSEPDQPLPADARPGDGIHHPIFGHKLKEQMDKLGLECIYRHTSDGQQPPPNQAMLEFFRDHLKPERGK